MKSVKEMLLKETVNLQEGKLQLKVEKRLEFSRNPEVILLDIYLGSTGKEVLMEQFFSMS